MALCSVMATGRLSDHGFHMETYGNHGLTKSGSSFVCQSRVPEGTALSLGKDRYDWFQSSSGTISTALVTSSTPRSVNRDAYSLTSFLAGSLLAIKR